MALKVALWPRDGHVLRAVFREEMDTGIAFDVVCLSCRRQFGGFKMDETLPGTIPMYQVVNECHTRLDTASEELSEEICDHGL